MDEESKEILRDIQRWLKIIGIQETRPLLKEVLSAEDDQEQNELRTIYHLTDGDHSTRDIADHVSLSRNSVSQRQKQWAKVGLVEKEHSQASYHHAVSLEEAGIEVPEIPDPDDEGDESNTAEDNGESEEVADEESKEVALTDY